VLPGVLVALPLAVSHERLLAASELACEGLHVEVDALVDAQVATLRETLPTLLALVGLFASVFADVRLQSIIP